MLTRKAGRKIQFPENNTDLRIVSSVEIDMESLKGTMVTKGVAESTNFFKNSYCLSVVPLMLRYIYIFFKGQIQLAKFFFGYKKSVGY